MLMSELYPCTNSLQQKENIAYLTYLTPELNAEQNFDLKNIFCVVFSETLYVPIFGTHIGIRSQTMMLFLWKCNRMEVLVYWFCFVCMHAGMFQEEK